MVWKCLLLATAALAIAAGAGGITLHLRTRVEPFKGSGVWHATTVDYPFEPRKTAIILCDLWDKHWCRG